MTINLVVEEALANSLKKLMMTKSIKQIHVKEITNESGLSRHTFYNHFHDIYELLKWIYEREVIEGIELYCSLDSWKKGIALVLNYTYENKRICLNTFNSLGRDHLESFLYQTFFRVVSSVVDEISRDLQLSEEVKDNCKDFYTNALMGVFISWLKEDLSETPESMARKIDQMLSGVVVYTLTKISKEANTL